MSTVLNCDDEAIKFASSLLKDGKVVIFPTETVYGIGGIAYNDAAILDIYRLKNRPSKNPLISHYASVDDVWKDAVCNDAAMALAEKFWPGPMTLVLPKRQDSKISKFASSGLPTIAVRVPAHPVAQKLISYTGAPIAAPSANKSTHLSGTNVEMICDDFCQDDIYIINNGNCQVGIESTIIDVTNPEKIHVLRYGFITEEDLLPICQLAKSSKNANDAPKAPGMMYKHYSPKNHRVEINSFASSQNDAFLDFGDHKDVQCKYYLTLSQTEDLSEAASNLFTMLYKLDNTDCQKIVIAPIPNEGIGIAINDKITRAQQDDLAAVDL